VNGSARPPRSNAAEALAAADLAVDATTDQVSVSSDEGIRLGPAGDPELGVPGSGTAVVGAETGLPGPYEAGSHPWGPATASAAGLADALAAVARTLQSERSAQATLQRVVDLAVVTIRGCDHAGVSMLDGSRVETSAASDGVPELVDRIQYGSGQGPCLSALWEHGVFQADDLSTETRWPDFSARAAAETGIHSILSYRLFLGESTFGSLNLYSARAGAFDERSRAAGSVFATHAAVALAAARGHDHNAALASGLADTMLTVANNARQLEVALALQRSMLPPLPDLAPLRLVARYVAAMDVTEIGGDWYDAFRLPDGPIALVVGDIEGHDLAAAARMGQTRSLLRALAVDRQDPPGSLLNRLDVVLDQLPEGGTCTCIYAHLAEGADGSWKAVIANAGHPPPLLVTAGGAAFLEATPELVLGTGDRTPRIAATFDLPPGSTLLLYTDGLVERRGRSLDAGLGLLRLTAGTLADRGPDELCDELLVRLSAHPEDDICLLAVAVPDAREPVAPTGHTGRKLLMTEPSRTVGLDGQDAGNVPFSVTADHGGERTR
jgi:serine phosphatase RsbU (regulator of sigma subunit)